MIYRQNEMMHRGKRMIGGKIEQIGRTITRYLFEECPKEYVKYVFGGKLNTDDFVDQVILECIKYAFDNTQEEHSIRYYLKKSGDLTADVRMKYSRIMSLVQEYKKKEIERLKSIGIYIDDEIEEMDSMDTHIHLIVNKCRIIILAIVASFY